MKGAYAYLHPDYWKRKLVHLVIVVPIVLFAYSLIDGLLMPWEPTILDTIVISALTLLSAYFYPFSLWWYRQSFTGSAVNDMVYIGSIWDVILRKHGAAFFGIVCAGVLAPIAGPLTLRKCRKKNIIIGEEEDFK